MIDRDDEVDIACALGKLPAVSAVYKLEAPADPSAFVLAVALRPYTAGFVAEAHYALGALFLGRREPQRALPHLETAVQLDPLSVAFRLALAGCYTTLERRSEATRELDLIDRLQPHLPQVAEMRALLARQRK